MRLHQIRVIKKSFRNNETGEIIDKIIELPKEGFNHEAILYRCSSCNELFFVSLEKLIFENNDVMSFVQGKNCPTCNASLKDTIEKSPQYFNPPKQVDNKHYELLDNGKDVFEIITSYDLAT
jgi:hypothetical protein